MKNKKGYALIYVMCAILILTAFTLSILTLTVSNTINTAYLRNSNRANLAAEAGMEAAVNNYKKYIAANFDEYVDRQTAVKTGGTPNSYNVNVQPSGTVNYTNDSTYSYTYSNNNNYTDPITGKSIQCTVINSIGTYGNVTKTITADIDENDISNVYYDKVFTQPITIGGNNIPSVTPQNFNQYNTTKDNGSTTKDNSNITMVSYKCKGTDGTLKQLTDGMYNDITTQKDGNNETIMDYINVDNSYGLIENGVKDFIASVESKDDQGNKTSYVKDMLKYSTVYKVLFVSGDLDVGIMKDPLINYIIYCDGDINIQPNSNLKMWNCNIYAKNITYDGHAVKFNYSNNNQTDPTLSYSYNGNNYPITDVVIKGINSSSAKTEILKQILANDDINNPTYAELKSNMNGRNAEDVLDTNMAGEFTRTDKIDTDSNFYKNIDGYAYGLKLRYLDITER